MERNEKNSYYHGGLGSENRRNQDRSSRDGDYGRDYENRFRKDRDRNEEYRRHHRDLENDYYQHTHRSGPDMSTIRQGYGIEGFGNNSRYTDTGEDIAQRMRRDRERLQQQGYGSGRTSGYSGSAFGGSNYSSHGDFSGSSDYGAMSGGDGNVDDYVSMSGYGGGRGSISASSDRGVPDYSHRRFGDRYSDDGPGLGMGRKGTRHRYSPDNYGGSTGNAGSSDYSDFERNSNQRNYSSNRNRIDRGGYRNYDPNNRWNS